MKTIITAFCAILLLVALTSTAFATEIPPGPVTGNWYATGNPYNINGNIYVPSNSSLVIHEGVQIYFQGLFSLRVDTNSVLQAGGTETDSILFTAQNQAVGWGLRFIYASDESLIKYCRLQYGHAVGSGSPGYGGAIYCQNSNIEIAYNTIYDNHASNGGGIACVYSNAFIHHNVIDSDTAQMFGGGILAYGLSPIINHNIIRNNYGVISGGISCNSEAEISSNIISGNGGIMGGGIYIGLSSPIISNCLIYNNSYIGIFCLGITNPIISNCTIYNNGIGIQNDQHQSFPIVLNSILFANTVAQIFPDSTPNISVSYSDIEGGYQGTGNINQAPLFTPGPEGNFYLSQIAAGQTQQSSCVNTGNPGASVPLGTTRTDGVQDAGVVDIGYHYHGLIPSSPVTVNLTPIVTPIQIPSTGGSFSFEATLHNNASSALTFSVWIVIQLPSISWYGPVLGPISLALTGGSTLIRLRNQFISANAPAGAYVYECRVGVYPDSIWDTDAFAFIKLGAGLWGQGSGEWLNTGDPFPGEENDGGRTPALQPEAFMVDVTPNPFNPSTAISYELQASSHVSLRVYDTAGKLVETVVDGWREAGAHEVTFDGSNLPSGVYMYRLEAGEYTTSGKMVLLK